MIILDERYTIEPIGAAFVRVEHVRVLETGFDTGGRLWMERASALWVAERIRTCIATYGFEPVSIHVGQDNLQVSESGPEQQPLIVIRNRRPAGSPYEGAYSLGLSKPIAGDFADALARLAY